MCQHMPQAKMCRLVLISMTSRHFWRPLQLWTALKTVDFYQLYTLHIDDLTMKNEFGYFVSFLKSTFSHSHIRRKPDFCLANTPALRGEYLKKYRNCCHFCLITHKAKNIACFATPNASLDRYFDVLFSIHNRSITFSDRNCLVSLLWL